ncbi:hypothetical protein [Paraburkholderia dioscoreae]|uniref:Uncharacterized protein n=1 Tax=Paraburkholderia dioscoreae TaxID=2604047 RepID=A0A5Q4ZDA7_9BURK|nr:hypothetical protein [Paraburkholderia dioscoreae]VVD29207.1 conserved protein of unknown function [Paraburkholderia dioscoreae]
MPKTERTPTPDTVLAAMEPDRHYSAQTIASMLSLRTDLARSLLNMMVNAGTLVRIQSTRKHPVRFAVAVNEDGEPQEEVQPTIATPRTHAVITGTLIGYDAEIARRAELCMIVRGVR